MSRKGIVKLVVIVLLIALAVVVVVKKGKENTYSVVYLQTGEVYVGKLTTTPTLQLRNGYILQMTRDAQDQTKTNFQLNPVSEALWAPEVMNLTRNNVIFYGPLLKDSKIAQTLAAQK